MPAFGKLASTPEWREVGAQPPGACRLREISLVILLCYRPLCKLQVIAFAIGD